jgi:hypothetical protein
LIKYIQKNKRRFFGLPSHKLWLAAPEALAVKPWYHRQLRQPSIFFRWLALKTKKSVRKSEALQA